MKKVTRQYMFDTGWRGYHVNSITGEAVPANYFLDNIAWTMNNKPKNLVYQQKDLLGEVYVYIKNDFWTPFKWTERYAARAMTESELREADERLAKMGISIKR